MFPSSRLTTNLVISTGPTGMDIVQNLNIRPLRIVTKSISLRLNNSFRREGPEGKT